ncbi:MAG: hypothetical protein K2X27_01965 [Candidatus Obscuribacterales bacterium]|nr:hypothetical protein [Candidatus Obscuribacterales bacterium]
MFIKNRVLALGAAVSLSLVLGYISAATASKGGDKVESDPNANTLNSAGIENDQTTARFASIPSSAANITVVAESAKVHIKRVAGISEITVFSNCPRNWWVKGSMIRQAGFAEVRKGTSLLADDLGSRAIVNGHVYLFPPGPMKGLSMGPSGVTVGGQAIEPLKGSDIPCNCSGEDLLVINVPQSYTGDLKIGSGGKSVIALDTWKDGAVECTMLGSSSLTSGKLESLAKAAFDNRGQGAAEISELDAKIFVASIRGQGNAAIRVKKGKAEMSNATVEGNGTIELHGNFKKLQQLVDGTGKIEVKP